MSIDNDKSKCDNKRIFHISKMKELVRNANIHIGIITVPKEFAQEVCDQMIESGIEAIWNFAPIHLDVPANILVQNENMATSLAVLSTHLQAQRKDKK